MTILKAAPHLYRQAKPALLTRVCAVLAVALQAACGNGAQPPPVRSGEHVTEKCTATSTADEHYAYGTMSEAYLVEAFVRRAKLPPLWCGAGADTYRFLRVPNYRPAVVVTVGKGVDGWTATASEYEDPRRVPLLEYVPEHVVRQTSRRISPAEVLELTDAIERAEYWSSPQSLADGTGFESAPWVIEARVGSSYRGVLRALGSYAQFRDVARLMMRLAELPLPTEMAAR